MLYDYSIALNKFNLLHMKNLNTLILLLFVSLTSSAGESTLVNDDGLLGYVTTELEKIALEAGEARIAISSKRRSVREQVEVMLDYYITCEKISDVKQKIDCGIDLAKKVYDAECQAGFSVYDPNVSRVENVNRMTDKLAASLVELGERRRCMNHVIVAGIKTEVIAIDIKPSSIQNKGRFYEAIKNNPNVVQFYYPNIVGKPKSEVKDAAFHIGFLRQ